MSQPERREQPWSSSGRPLWLLVTVGLFVICLLLGMIWATTTPIIDEIVKIERYRLPKIELLQVIKNADLEASVALRNVLLVKDQVLNDQELERYAKASESAKSALSDFGSKSYRPEEIELLRRTLAARSRLERIRAEAIEEDRLGGLSNPDALTLALQTVLGDYVTELRRLQDYESLRIAALVDDMAARTNKVRLLLIASGIVAAITMVSLAVAWRAELRRQVKQLAMSIASLQSQKAALVREVHHRIKNHLQGLLGLLETHMRTVQDTSGAASSATLYSHVLALIGIHGLQAGSAEDVITLKDLVRNQVEQMRVGFPNAQLAVTEDNNLGGTTLGPDQAVPVALMVTELIVNAIKHGAPSPIRISIGLEPSNKAYVSVTNRLISPSSMDWSSGQGLGTGLGLVSTLSEGIAELVQRTTPEVMAMTLSLTPLPSNEMVRS